MSHWGVGGTIDHMGSLPRTEHTVQLCSDGLGFRALPQPPKTYLPNPNSEVQSEHRADIEPHTKQIRSACRMGII